MTSDRSALYIRSPFRLKIEFSSGSLESEGVACAVSINNTAAAPTIGVALLSDVRGATMSGRARPARYGSS